jgi:hypothetical protein
VRLNNLADAIEAKVMKKTTQRSPEWWGAANRVCSPFVA